MDLRLTLEQVQLRDATRRVLAERLASLVEQLPEPPVHDLPQAVRDGQALGWLGLGLPEELGGAGGFSEVALVHEELGRGLAPSLVSTLAVAGRLLLHLPPDPVRDHLLAQLSAGSALLCPALGDAFVMTTDTAGATRLDGLQRHVVDAAAASQLVVPARTEDGGPLHLFLVSPRAPGVVVDEQRGTSDIPHCTVTLTGVSVPAEALLTSDAAGALRAVRTEATVLAAARAVGGGRAVLDRTVEHVRTRHQFDRPIGTFQAVQHQLADVATALDAAGLAVARATWAVESGQDSGELEAATAIAGLTARDAFANATLVAHQLHGGMGFVLDSPLHLWSARAIADPTAPGSRRQLLDLLGAALGLSAQGLRTPADHRRVGVVP